MLDVLSWNLNGLDAADLGPRLEAALQDILLDARLERVVEGQKPKAPPHLLLLQEVTAGGFYAQLKPHLRAAGFELFPSTPPDRSYFELCAVRKPLTVLDFRSEPLTRTMYGRWLHELHIGGLGKAPWTVLTAHMDSGPEPLAAQARGAQARDIASRMSERSLFAGDTNLREKEWKALAPSIAVRDAWEAAGCPAEHRFTWFGHERKARFDRAWITQGLEVEDFRTVGHEPIHPGGGSPSDHLGLRLRVVDPGEGEPNQR